MQKVVCQPPRDVGFSLIEILFALVITTTVLAIAIPRIQTGFEIHLKAAARKLASAIRFSYNEAAMKSKYFRIVFAFDPQKGDSYRIEVADRAVLVRSPEEEEDFQKKLKNMNEKERKAALEREPNFAIIEAHLSKPVSLPRGVHFKDIFVEHQTERVAQGHAYMYFFPTGFTERAVINLEDNDGNIYGLEVAPMTGKVRVEAEYLEYAKH